MHSDSKWLRAGVVVAIIMGIPPWITFFRPNIVPHPDPPSVIAENTANQSDYLMVGRSILVGIFYAAPAAGSLFLLIAAFVVFRKPKKPLLDESDKSETSRLVIYSAIYDAVDGGGKIYDVAEFLRQIVTGDSLVLDIENHNFSINGQNFVPQDPKRGANKRLVVTYSFDSEPSSTVERLEGSRIVLPEDSYLKELKAEKDLVLDKTLELTLKVDELRRLDAQNKSDLYRTKQFRDGYKEERDQARQELQALKDAAARGPIFDVQIYRIGVGRKLPFAKETQGIFEAVGRDDFKIGVDILLEMYVVNISSETQYVREVCGHVEIDGEKFPMVMQRGFDAWEFNGQKYEWCLDPTPKDMGSTYDRQIKLEALPPLSATYPIALDPKKPLEGWLRLLISEINPVKLDGVTNYNLTIKDSLGIEHPITKIVTRNNRGEISTRQVGWS